MSPRLAHKIINSSMRSSRYRGDKTKQQERKKTVTPGVSLLMRSKRTARMLDVDFHQISRFIVDIDIQTFLVILISIILIVILVNHNFKNQHKYSLAAKIPGPPALPLIGNVHFFIGLDMSEYFQKLDTLKKQYGFPLRFWLGPELWVAIFDPKDLQAVLTSENSVNKSSSYSVFRSFSNGIFIAQGDNWRRLRKIVNPTFHMKLLEKFVTDFNMQAEILVKLLAPQADNELFDIHPYMARLGVDTICGTQMGVVTKEQLENKYDVPNNVSKVLQIILMRIYKGYLRPDFIFNLTSHRRTMKECAEPVLKFIREVIKQRMQSRAEELKANGTERNGLATGMERGIFLDSLLKSSSAMSVEELVECTIDMLVASYDTTSVTLSSLFLMLAMHPDIQEKLYNEQCDIFTNLDSPITMADLNEMKYLDMVLKETMRIFCVPVIARELLVDLDIENYTLPAGAHVYISIYLTHRDPRFWEDPDKFDPERFTPENVASRPKYSYVPFSMGPRNCPGYKFGILSMKAVISHVIRKYKFTTPLKMEELKYKMGLVVMPVQGYHLKMQKRYLGEQDVH